MQEVLAIALRSMHADMTRLEKVGGNLANASTPAYQRDVVAVRSATAAEYASSVNFESLMAASSSRPEAFVEVRRNLQPGTLRSTGQSLDLALTAEGYFEVQTANGPAYTRNGAFQLDGSGRLVTLQGEPVMSMGGEVRLPNAMPFIDGAGHIFDRSMPGTTDTTAIAQLKLVKFESPQALERIGHGLFISKSEPTPVEEASAGVRQGFLENSNVNSMHEMVEMMRTMRHFESMQKVALGYDEMIGTAVRKLGDLS